MDKLPVSFVAFDLETTGFQPPSCRIIEIGAVKVINEIVVEQWQRFVNPGCVIPADITALTGIDNSMVIDAFPIEMILPEFLDFAGDLPLAAHNIKFDMNFIQYDAKRIGVVVQNDLFDTVLIGRKIFPNLVNHKLGTVARHLDVLGDTEHRGLQDALVVAKIMIHALHSFHN